MEKKTTTKRTVKKQGKPVERSKQLLSIDEFFIGYPMRKERKAAIKIKLDENEFHSRTERKKIIEEL